MYSHREEGFLAQIEVASVQHFLCFDGGSSGSTAMDGLYGLECRMCSRLVFLLAEN